MSKKKGGAGFNPKLPTTEAVARAHTGAIPVFCSHDEIVEIGKMIPNPQNPNQHPDDQIKLLAQIIKGQGWRAPITVSNRSGFIVKGHGRLAAARFLGLETVPVDFQNYATEAEEFADMIADNRLSELSEINNAQLMDLIAEMDSGELPLIYTGYTEDDLESILAALAGADDAENSGEDDVPEIPIIPMSQPGDLWYCGPHKVLCGSATDKIDVDRIMDGEKARCVHTDPPYGVSYETQSGKFEMLKNDNLTGDDLVNTLLLPAFRHYVEHTVEDAAFYIWHASATRDDFKYAMTKAGIDETQYLIWVKNGISLGRSDYQWAHEPCFYGGKNGISPAFFGDRAQHTVLRATLKSRNGMETSLGSGLVLTDGAGNKVFMADKPPKNKKVRYIRMDEGQDITIATENKHSTIWEISRETGTEHPTQKPVELTRRAIENSTEPGDLVLDFFGGSGSTLIGAELTSRRCNTIELDPQYVDVIVHRYVRATKNSSVMCERNGQRIPYAQLAAEAFKLNEEARAKAGVIDGKE